jgi:hypothetical protein
MKVVSILKSRVRVIALLPKLHVVSDHLIFVQLRVLVAFLVRACRCNVALVGARLQ